MKKIEAEHQAALEALRRLVQSYPITIFHDPFFYPLLDWPFGLIAEAVAYM